MAVSPLLTPDLPTLGSLATLLQEPAATEPKASGGGMDIYLLLIALFAVFYFVMILPEKKNRKKREQMLTSLAKGDRVMTTSGLHGSVVTAQGDVVTLQVADGVRLRFNRSAIQSRIEGEADAPEGGREAAKEAGAAS